MICARPSLHGHSDAFMKGFLSVHNVSPYCLYKDFYVPKCVLPATLCGCEIWFLMLLHYQGLQIKENEMSGVCSINGRDENSYKIVAVNPE